MLLTKDQIAMRAQSNAESNTPNATPIDDHVNLSSPTLPLQPPRIARSELWGPRGPRVVGHGGNRGAVVSAVDSPNLPRRAFKDYLQPRTVPHNEKSFLAAALELKRRSSDYQTLLQAHENHADGATYDFALWTNLMIPEAIVDEEGHDRGILMPMLSCNLHDFLAGTRLPVSQFDENPSGIAAFRFEKRFEPIDDPIVIAAILFQTARAVSLLNTSLPHKVISSGTGHHQRRCPAVVNCKGYTHNDLHLANLLLHYDTGAVVLCDFELVQHLAADDVDQECGVVIPRSQELMERTPPLHRHPPQGLAIETSDAWGLGLVAVDMLTGVAPFIDEVVARDDFGDGPLLLPHDEAGGAGVIDWDSNMLFHVTRVRNIQPGTCPVTDLIYDFCRQCLSNRENHEPPTVTQLLQEHALFRIFDRASSCGVTDASWQGAGGSELQHIEGAQALLRAHEVVRRFVDRPWQGKPPDRARVLHRNMSSSMTGSCSSIASLGVSLY